MGCLIKTLEKGFIRLDKEHSKKKNNQNNKTRNNKKVKIEEKSNENTDKETDMSKPHNNINENNSGIKNQDNYFKSDQVNYYINVYLINHIQEEPKEKINYKR